MERLYGGVELGGTKVVCAVGRGNTIVATERLPTRDPESTLAGVIAFLRGHGPLEAVGAATFGPVELRPGSPRFGRLLETPKEGWSGVDIAGALGRELRRPVAIDTDVNGAAVAEGRFGAATGLDSFVYLTVGTGIGGGAVVGGHPAHGLVHPEIGHLSVPREPGDDYPGRCPFHRDCLEGMTSGPALAERFGARLEELAPAAREEARALAAGYLASGLRNIVYALAPERIVIGGGVASLEGLHALVHARLLEVLGRYPGLPEHASPGFVVPPGLGGEAGIVGALVLAETVVAVTA